MIGVEEARSTILSKTERLETEEVSILESLGRVLDEDAMGWANGLTAVAEDMELKPGDTVTVQLMEPNTD
ncbi:MAG: hypothetical protein QME41_03940 [Actinomycetota bacterium]|nr:hypothetical protein [Actinomycetota bacterium]